MVLLFLYAVYTYYYGNPLVQPEQEDGAVQGEEDQYVHGIPVFVRPRDGEEVFIANITNVIGYTSLARRIQHLSHPLGLDFPVIVPPQVHSPHVLWPWSNFRVHYDCLWDQGTDLMLYWALDPIGLDRWSDFIRGLGRIVLEEDEDGIKIPIHSLQEDPNLSDRFLLRKYLVGNRIRFYRMLQIALYAYWEIELPAGQLWNGEGDAQFGIAPGNLLFTFYDEPGNELVPPDNDLVGHDWAVFEANLSSIVI
nr:hypothetical protein Iba_chr11aCG5190 [Ipomoea batatas]GMD85166.1 hypothetical protein Iba_scaffold1591597CG0010 [Ipomoea batatas]